MTDDPMYPGWKRIKTHDQYMDVVAKERKVIEAAKALHEARQMRYGWKRDKAEEMALFAMDDAVEALASLTK